MLKDPLSTKPTHTQTYQSRQSPFSNIEWLKLQLLFHEYHLPLYKQILALSNYWQYHTWKSFVKIEPVLTEVHKSVWYDKEMFIFVCLLWDVSREKWRMCVCNKCLMKRKIIPSQCCLCGWHDNNNNNNDRKTWDQASTKEDIVIIYPHLV